MTPEQWKESYKECLKLASGVLCGRRMLDNDKLGPLHCTECGEEAKIDDDLLSIQHLDSCCLTRFFIDEIK